jgi:hypothetical protein
MIELTHLLKSSGVLTKRIHLTDTGTPVSDGSACIMSSGKARRMRVNTLGEFGTLIQGLDAHEAIALGALREDLPDQVHVTTAPAITSATGATSRRSY